MQSAFLCCAFAFTYFETLRGLIVEWHSSSSYSYGFLIPAVSAYLIWGRRRQLSSAVKGVSMPGLWFFLASLGMFIVGFAADEESLIRLSLPFTLFSLIWFLCGAEVARIVRFPVAYLALMIPPPFPIYKEAALRLRLFDAKIVALISSLLGVPTYRDGYFLHLPNVTLEVADGCSGVFSIVALVALGLLYIHFVEGRGKICLGFLLIPIAVLSNIIRIAGLAVGCHYFGNWVLDSTFHRMSGMVNFLLGLSLLLALGRLVELPRSEVVHE